MQTVDKEFQGIIYVLFYTLYAAQKHPCGMNIALEARLWACNLSLKQANMGISLVC